MVTLSMPQRTALDLEQLSFRILFGKCFGRVWDGLGSFLGVVWKCKSSDFVKDILKKIRFSDDELRNHLFKPSWKALGTPLGTVLELSGRAFQGP